MNDMDGDTVAGEEGRQQIREAAAEQFAAEHGDRLEQMSDEQAAEIAGPPVHIQLPMQNLVLHGANVRINKGVGENGDETALIIGPVAFTFILPLNEEGARQVARELTGGIEIAHALPTDLKVVKR
jgi:hypothetical protein